MKKILFLIIICFCLSSIKAYSNNNIHLSEFKNYLRTIKSVAIDFTQEDSYGKIVKGKLLIQKPYNFRCNYYPPFPLVIIGTKNFVSIYDYDMEQVSRINRSENIFNFLLEDNEDYDKDFVLESIINKGNIVNITIYHSKTEKRSEITFNKNIKQIEKLKIFEDHNMVTITFDKITKVRKFSDDLFKFKNPEIFSPPERLIKSEIEKKYVVSSK
ncbi:outer-membrane lipoprotein carrier protein LolA [Rickettsia typhi]|uniref:Outer membrane lipoprotein carrier protein LolA n=2 Tax=Rickettsia typhi TaxID=785 RepID=Q68VP9_RICTY|nr:outer-membrane lipoprotein carrier protein LolA [Rickettsia typhi]AAU04307.1 conserved hypothetical protein [Rickettsia typhi str. Wilmington]AFE54684.1 outer membrane lipoprotein-sorting protein LolA [Rickettsia typhi str. TH1527]AFE55523.1 outer membrane lipoprotein-sorting protein LolA [Rickettsia typhi str. B9991CWPP]